MSRGLAGRLEAIVTTDAVAGQGCMVDETNDSPVRRDVTIGAFSQR